MHKSADTSRYPLGFHYTGWEVSDGNPDARFNATHAIELEVTAEFRARYVDDETDEESDEEPTTMYS